MSLLLKGVTRIGYYTTTVLSKIRWKGLSIHGLFRKRHDTQIIISENGKMCLGVDMLFQRNVSLTSVGGGTHYWKQCLI